MSSQARPSIRTAAPDDSIWQDIPEEVFRQHLVTLEERTNAIPIRPWKLSHKEHERSSTTTSHALTIDEEQRLADDLAYLAAIGEGAQSVAAVCIEENLSSQGMCIRLAAADAVDAQVRVHLEAIGQFLMSLKVCDHDSTTPHADSLLTNIIELHHSKMLGRLRSCKWQKPKYLSRTHKKPLWENLDNLTHRVQHVYTKKNHPMRAKVNQQISHLQDVLKAFEGIPSDQEEELVSLKEIVESCYLFCESIEINHFAKKLEGLGQATSQIAGALKALYQIEKIGAFRRIAIDMIARTQQYPSLFSHINFEYMQPYSVQSTDIGYESWAKTIHVHAEIQLIIYYDISDSTERGSCFRYPRTIGTSKYLCYLCFLFMHHHGRFSPVNTHGRLYDQWTIPDLVEYDDMTKQNLKDVIRRMDSDITKIADDVGPRQGKRDAWRVEPMTSRQNLLHFHIDEPEAWNDQQHNLRNARSAEQMYNARAVEYNDSWHPQFAADMVKWASIQPSDKVLDLACGTGLVSLAAAAITKDASDASQGQVVAVDIADDMLSIARTSAVNQNVTGIINFIKHDITQLNTCSDKLLVPGSFDKIISASCLPLLSDPKSALAHWATYLKLGGRLVVDVLTSDSQIPGLLFEQAVEACGAHVPWCRTWIQDIHSVTNLFEAAGLRVEKSFTADGYRSAKGPYSVDDGEKIVQSFLESPSAISLRGRGAEFEEMVRREFLIRWKERARLGIVDEVEGFYVVVGVK